jgi:hypothetical protein
MRVYFEATIDELIDVHEHAIKRSKSFRSEQRRNTVIGTILGGVFTGVGTYFVIIWMATTTTAIALGFALMAALGGAVASWSSSSDKVRQRLQTFIREQYGDRTSFPCEIELNESGICIKQLGVQHISEWSNVEELRETEDNIEFYMYGGGITFVKKRAFTSGDEEQKFISKVEQYLNTSRTSSNWLRNGL